MNYKLIFDIARSLLFARLKQTMVAAVGVTFSITMFITLLSFMTGLNNLLDGLIINRLPHVRLYNEVKPNVHQPINNTDIDVVPPEEEDSELTSLTPVQSEHYMPPRPFDPP